MYWKYFQRILYSICILYNLPIVSCVDTKLPPIHSNHPNQRHSILLPKINVNENIANLDNIVNTNSPNKESSIMGDDERGEQMEKGELFNEEKREETPILRHSFTELPPVPSIWSLYMPTEAQLLFNWEDEDECMYTKYVHFRTHAMIPFKFYHHNNIYTTRHFWNHLAIIQHAVNQHPKSPGNKMYFAFTAFTSYVRFVQHEDNTQEKSAVDKECFEFFDKQLSCALHRPSSLPSSTEVFTHYNQYKFHSLQSLYRYHYERWNFPLPILNLIVRGYLILVWNYMKTLPVFLPVLQNMEVLFNDLYEYFTIPSLFCGNFNTYNHYALLIDSTFSAMN